MDLLENWINGNRKDVVAELIKDGRLSEAIEFALSLPRDDRQILLTMLRNRDK